MKYFAMVTTKDSLSYTYIALQSFFQHTTLGTSDVVVLIDNDGSFNPALLQHKNVFGPIEYICNSQPKGFAENINGMIARCLSAGADLFFLNNDVVFSPGWLETLSATGPFTISTPLSNREVQYDFDAFRAKLVMGLEDYQGREVAFDLLCQEHQRHAQGVNTVLTLPFFCVRLPLAILEHLGFFDENFGRGGGEDFDYCLRAYLAGYRVCYALSSYMLHFGGKSSYSGAETTIEQENRELRFRTYFALKWGIELTKLILFEDRELLKTEFPHLVDAAQEGEHSRIVRELMGEQVVAISLWEQSLIDGLPPE